MKEYFLSYHHSRIHYSVFGNGEKQLFCFHGYGENGSCFELLEPLLQKDFTMLCIDFPFHGKTEWNEKIFAPADLINIISLIKQQNHQTSKQINLLGYSMGGRIALQLLQLVPEKIERIVLVAPDGLHKNFWYWFSTQTWIGNKTFNHIIYHPKGLLGLMKIAEKLNLMNKNILKISHNYLDDEKERKLLYKRWTIMRKFSPHLYLIKKYISEKNIPSRLLFGKYDTIILSKRSNFLKEDKKNIRIYVIEAAHQLLKEKYVEELAKLFYQ